MSKSLRQLRYEREWSQAELAQRANTDQPTIAQWENGNKFPNRQSIEKLADAFGLPPAAIFEAALLSKKRKKGQAAPLEESDSQDVSYMALFTPGYAAMGG